MKITGTFIDEISHDIPHQNWGPKEWRADFANMQRIGIDTVILIRCGYKKWLTYPSEYLVKNECCYTPTIDLISLFLDLSEEFGLDFFIGLYDSGKYWWEEGNFQKEIDINKQITEEIWKKYGHKKAFKGWYLSQEVSRKSSGIINLYQDLGLHCKSFSPDFKTLISPYIDGSKAILSSKNSLNKEEQISINEHEKEWDEIFDQIKGSIDIVAFQDGHVDYNILQDYLKINKALADKYQISSWTNAESFDRDMPIKFLPIKWEKLKLKLDAAERAGMEKAITFEFSHFMSPQSAYVQAHHLFNRYREHYKIV